MKCGRAFKWAERLDRTVSGGEQRTKINMPRAHSESRLQCPPLARSNNIHITHIREYFFCWYKQISYRQTAFYADTAHIHQCKTLNFTFVSLRASIYCFCWSQKKKPFASPSHTPPCVYKTINLRGHFYDNSFIYFFAVFVAFVVIVVFGGSGGLQIHSSHLGTSAHV